jgi:hypothetical protein
MIHTTFAIKQDTLYVAYAPEFDVSAWGTCQDEALNNLSDALRQQHKAGESTGDEKNSHAVN